MCTLCTSKLNTAALEQTHLARTEWLPVATGVVCVCEKIKSPGTDGRDTLGLLDPIAKKCYGEELVVAVVAVLPPSVPYSSDCLCVCVLLVWNA